MAGRLAEHAPENVEDGYEAGALAASVAGEATPNPYDTDAYPEGSTLYEGEHRAG